MLKLSTFGFEKYMNERLSGIYTYKALSFAGQNIIIISNNNNFNSWKINAALPMALMIQTMPC